VPFEGAKRASELHWVRAFVLLRSSARHRLPGWRSPGGSPAHAGVQKPLAKRGKVGVEPRLGREGTHGIVLP
jgi:hypothetical protein